MLLLHLHRDYAPKCGNSFLLFAMGSSNRAGIGPLESRRMKRRKRLWYWLLIVPFIATLWPPFYAHKEPAVGGLPFFYWYQMLWVVLTALLLGFVLLLTNEPEDV